MTAMNTARKKGTKMELAASSRHYDDKTGRINSAGTLAVRFTLLSIGTSSIFLF